MILNKKPIKTWFGFTRRERRSTFLLLLIVIMIIALRYAVPEKNLAIEDISSSISGVDSLAGLLREDISSPGQPFSFDPNTASYDTLIKLGLAAKEARTFINYRSKGGKFRQPADIRRVYGIEERKAEQLISFVEFKTNTTKEVTISPFRKQNTLLDLNNCDSAALVRLPGIGPVLSARIIKYRHLLGGFTAADQLKEVYGLPDETFEIIKGSLLVDTLEVARINVNSADYKELTRLPYFEKYEVTSILKYRELKGRLTGISDLTENKLITREKAAKVRPYLRFQ
jgi:competence protein ComEA